MAISTFDSAKAYEDYMDGLCHEALRRGVEKELNRAHSCATQKRSRNPLEQRRSPPKTSRATPQSKGTIVRKQNGTSAHFITQALRLPSREQQQSLRAKGIVVRTVEADAQRDAERDDKTAAEWGERLRC